MKLIIENFEIAETEALKKAVERAKRFAPDDSVYDHIKIICNARTPDDAVPYLHPGWLEYWICFYKFERGDVANMAIAMIQRTKNAEFEFHS